MIFSIYHTKFNQNAELALMNDEDNDKYFSVY